MADWLGPNSAELIDRLAILQLKEVHFTQDRDSFTRAIHQIEQDLDRVFESNNLWLDASLIRLVVALAQINCEIWILRDEMKHENGCLHTQAGKESAESTVGFYHRMKLSHQLNAFRNRLKNRLLDRVEGGDGKVCVGKKTNTNPEDLAGWYPSILEESHG